MTTDLSVTLRNEADVGFVEMDNPPPVNAINQSMRQGLRDAVRWAEELHLTRVILSGKGRAFAAGADAREFDQAPQEPHLPDVLNAIDGSSVPWIAAIKNARAMIAKKSPDQIAPERAIDVVAAGLALPFHDALSLERSTFVELKSGDQARALR